MQLRQLAIFFCGRSGARLLFPSGSMHHGLVLQGSGSFDDLFPSAPDVVISVTRLDFCRQWWQTEGSNGSAQAADQRRGSHLQRPLGDHLFRASHLGGAGALRRREGRGVGVDGQPRARQPPTRRISGEKGKRGRPNRPNLNTRSSSRSSCHWVTGDQARPDRGPVC